MATINKDYLRGVLNGEIIPDRDDIQSERMSNQDLKQAMLDSLADSGADTRNHTHSRDLPSGEDYRQAEADAAVAQQQEWFNSTRKRWGESSASGGMSPAGSNPLALNSNQDALRRKLNNL